MAVLATACSKELSFEEGGNVFDPTGGTSEGVLSGAPGACAGIVVGGLYGQNLPLDTSNKIVVEINFSQVGTYAITTDTINGIYFTGTGSVSGTGVTPITLMGNGTPMNPGQFTLQVRFKTSACSFVVPVYAVAQGNNGDYFPTTAGSNWTYISSDPAAGPGDTANQVATNTLANISGQSYNLFELRYPLGKDSSYFRKGGGDYWEYADLDVAGVADAPAAGAYVFLKDNVPAGTTWTSTEATAPVAGVPARFRLRLQILEKDVKVLIDNKIYVNTIKVNTTQQVETAPGTWTDLFAYQTWFAKGIGLVNVVAPAPAYGYSVLKFTVN